MPLKTLPNLKQVGVYQGQKEKLIDSKQCLALIKIPHSLLFKAFSPTNAISNCTMKNNLIANQKTSIEYNCTKLRDNCILLINCYLFKYNIVENHLRSCGKDKDTYHYFSSVLNMLALEMSFSIFFSISDFNFVNTST